MDLSIIIVNWNAKEMLKSCLHSLERNTDRNKVKIIVVDNLSHDGSRDMIRTLFARMQLINSGSNIGFGRACNLAISYADTPLILFLNPDTVVTNNAIDKMIDFMNTRPMVGALGCKLKDPPNKINPGTVNGVHNLGLQWFPTPLNQFFSQLFLTGKTIELLKNHLPYQDPNKSGFVSKVYGGCLMVRKIVLEQVGYFDERFFMYCEDIDLCYRIGKSDWKQYYLSEAEIIHFVGGVSDNAGSQFSTLMMCESTSKFLYKYQGITGKLFYKMSVFMNSYFRLFILGILNLISHIIPSLSQKINFKNSFNKHLARIKWSLNLQKATIGQ